MDDCFQRKTNLLKSQHYHESQQLATTFNGVFSLCKCQSTVSHVRARTGIFLVNDGCDCMKLMCMKSSHLFFSTEQRTHQGKRPSHSCQSHKCE